MFQEQRELGKMRKLEKLENSDMIGEGRIVRRHALLATAEEEDQRVECIDDITGKELPWSEVRQAGE